MKKEDFVKLGLDEETAKKCETASAEELKSYIPKKRFDEVNEEKKTLETSLSERDGQLETLKNSTGDVEGMRTQIKTLQADNKKKDEDHKAEIKQLKIDSAVNSAITGAKGKNSKAIKALLDLENAELLDNGTVKGVTEQLEKLAKAEDSKFLFGASSIKGAKPGEGSDPEDNDFENPWSKESYNLTKQGEILKKDPELAKQLMRKGR